MAEAKDLPGWPKKKLVREVRRHLAFYGIHPTDRGAIAEREWKLAWSWANDVANSYVFKRWPLVSEIAAQYVFLLLARMQINRHLKLPYRASRCRRVPASELQNVDDLPRLTVGQTIPLIYHTYG